nr:hypothetical protein [Tanacetum cinerariifolium]
MTDYSLWEVILNGDSPIPTRVIDGIVQPVAPTTAEQRLARKNELKARESLSQEDINLKFLRSLPEGWRTHTLIWRNKTDLEDQSLDDMFNILKIYEAKVKSSSSTSPNTQNIAFMSSQNTDSTNESVSAVASISVASTKVHVSALPNVNTLSNAVIYSFFASQYNSPQKGHFARECMSPKDTRRNVQVEAQRRNVPAEEEPTNYALMAFTFLSSSSSDNEVASYSKAYTKAYATLQSHYDKLTNDLRKSQFDVISYNKGLESVEARILVYQQNETVFEEDIKLIKLDVQLRDNALVDLRKKFEKAEQERDELKLKLDKFQTSSKNLSQLLASKTNDKTGLGYDNQVFNSSVFDCDEMFSSKSDVSYDNQVFTSSMFDCDEMFSSGSDVSMPASPIYDRPSVPLIEDWVSDSKDDSEGEPKHTHITPSFVQPTEHVWIVLECTKITKKPDNNCTRIEATRKARTRSKFFSNKLKAPKVNAVKGVQENWGNLQHVLKDKRVIDSGCSRNITGNMSYLNDFEDINGGYVAFGGNPKGGKITCKGKIRTETALPVETTLPAGTVLPAGTALPPGTTLPAGTALPAGTPLPVGTTTLPVGTITLPVGTTTLPVGTTYLIVETKYYNYS